MEKLYDRIDWHNNTTPALNETNLNRMSKSLDDLDDRVVDIAGTVMETVPQIQEDLAEAQELIEDAEELTTHPPIIRQNGHWWTWDTSIDDYADSGVDAGVSLTIGTTTTLSPGSNATVENVGTDTDPILNFGIPKGAKGDTGSTGATPNITATATVDANVGTPSVNVTKSGTAENPSLAFAFSNIKGAKGDTGATGQTGPAGQGVPTGGTTGQVLAKKSNSNYDTEWKTTDDNKAYHTDDTAETTLADGDYFPFYDTSATAKRKTLWSNIVSVLRNIFVGKSQTAGLLKNDGSVDTTAYQPSTLATPIKVAGVNNTTVQTALSALEDKSTVSVSAPSSATGSSATGQSINILGKNSSATGYYIYRSEYLEVRKTASQVTTAGDYTFVFTLPTWVTGYEIWTTDGVEYKSAVLSSNTLTVTVTLEASQAMTVRVWIIN